MTPNDCPRFEFCSAPICPLDTGWRLRTHFDGERVCSLMLEAVKDDAEANLRGVLPWEVHEAVVRATPDILARWNPIKKAARRASATGSRTAAGKRLNATRASPGTPQQKVMRGPLQRHAHIEGMTVEELSLQYTAAPPRRATRG